MPLSPDQKIEVNQMIKDLLSPLLKTMEENFDDVQKSLASFGGEEFSNLSVFSKPMQLFRSLRMLPYTPAQITAAVNDYDTGDTPVLRVSSDASRNITGFKNGYNGRILVLINVGGQDVVLKDEDSGSVAANRIACRGSADLTLNAEDAVILWYDITSLRWRTIFS